MHVGFLLGLVTTGRDYWLYLYGCFSLLLIGEFFLGQPSSLCTVTSGPGDVASSFIQTVIWWNGQWSNLNLKDRHKQYFVYSKVDFKVNTVNSSKCVLAGPVHMHIWIILCNTDQFYFLFLLLIKIYLCYFEIEPWEWYFLLTFARTYVRWKQGDANITAAATATSMRISTPLWVRVINWCIQG